MDRRSRTVLFLTAFALAAVLLTYASILGSLPPSPASAPGSLLVALLDVGQADSIFVQAPSGRTMLVDAGNESEDAQRAILPFIKARKVETIDYLVLTHPHQDHVGGMPAIIEAIGIGAFVDSAQPGVTNQTYMRTLELVRRKGIKPMKARAGDTRLDLGPEMRVEVLGPEEPLFSGDEAATNNNSVVLRLTYGEISVLLTGDIETEAIKRLLDKPVDLRSQILKVAHHGSRTGTTTEWLEKVQPKVALISVGAGNPYGHPHRQTLQRLQERGAQIYRTDRHGTVTVEVDGRSYRVGTERIGGSSRVEGFRDITSIRRSST